MHDQSAVTHGARGTVSGRPIAVRRADDATAEAVRLELSTGAVGSIVLDSDCPGRNRDWTADEWYRFDGVLGVDPELALRSRAERVRDALDALDGIERLDDVSDTECPVCGGPIDDEDALRLADSTESLIEAIDSDLVGIGDSELSVDALGPEAVDWRPMSRASPSRSETHRSSLVCEACGADVTAHYRERIRDRRREQRTNRGSGMNDIVNAALESPEASSFSPSTDAGAMASRAAVNASADVGMATGGAKDANSFRDNILQGYVPQPDSLAYEGLFYDYHFDTGDLTGGEGLFYPSYSMAVSEDPLTGEVERYLTVGLNSNLTEADLERKPLNLVAVVDVSGSMSSQFDQYYYDEHGRRREIESGAEPEGTKMAAARRALSALTEQLRPEDRLGVVLYNNDAHVAKPLRRVEETNMEAIRGHIAEITAGGGTDMSAGFSVALELLEPHHDADLTEVENRVVFMSDAMPNLGTTDRTDITDVFADAADRNVHTTFVGIGLDTNVDLVESLSTIRGANHYFVHSTEAFTQRLAEEFTYMVTPLVFDLRLDLVSGGYEIEAVYGSPNADRSTGEVMHVTTLFPSPTSEGETRGGVTLLRLRGTGSASSLELVANWVERDGTAGRDAVELSFPSVEPERFDNSGIRKAVLLARYGRLLREWMAAVRSGDTEPGSEDGIDDWTFETGRELGQWEERSVPLEVPGPYREEFRSFQDYLREELDVLDDEDLEQEREILALLSDPEAIADTRADEDAGSDAGRPAGTSPDVCPNCGEDISRYGPGAHFCPDCGMEIS